MPMSFLVPTFHLKILYIVCVNYNVIFTRMVANYLVMTNLLQLKDTIWALILPLALGPFNILVMRTFSRKPCLTVLLNRHRIDGASEMRIFVSIVLPLAVPGIATISLFAALGYWNDWFNALLYIQKIPWYHYSIY